MLADQPEYAELFDYVARKGRSFRITFCSHPDTGCRRIKDIDKNTSYRIGLKVPAQCFSSDHRVDDAYHIESGKEYKGIGFLVPAPGAARSSSAAPMLTVSMTPADSQSPCFRIDSRTKAVHRRAVERIWAR